MFQLLIIIFVKIITGIFYQGDCPEPDSLENFSCKWYSENFLTLVSLPTSNYTLNFFHNAFEKPDCSSYRISCAVHRMYRMSVTISCVNITMGAKYCYPLNINRLAFSESFDVSFDFVPEVKCSTSKIWNKFHFLYHIEDILYVFWSCRPISNDMNEQGMLVLLNEKFDSAENRSRYLANVLGNVDEKFIHEKDLVHNDFNKTSCNCENCDYFMECKTASGFDMIDISPAQSEKLDLPSLILIFMILLILPIVLIILKFISSQDSAIGPVEFIENDNDTF